MFQSRLQHNIREEKGYSYGVNSSFAYGKGPGRVPRRRRRSSRAKTDSALVEFMKELKGVAGRAAVHGRGAGAGRRKRSCSVCRVRFASVQSIGDAIARSICRACRRTTTSTFAAKVNAVTKEDLVRVAKKYIDLEHLDIVIVGDRAVIEEPLRKTKIRTLVFLDIDGKPLRAMVTP